MSDIIYSYGPGSYRTSQLETEIVAAGLPAPVAVNGSGYTDPGSFATTVQVHYAAPLSPAGVNTLGDVVAAHVPAGPRQPRPLWAIRADVQALSTGQFGNVWNDLSAAAGSVPRKYLTDYGVNAGSIFCYDHLIYVVQGTAAQVRAGQISLTSLYCQDNPKYLVNPPFDTSIDVPGDQPA
jgi:hypothetical protein